MSNFSELSGGEKATFLVRWRGRQEGPFSASTIETKLATNEIGLLHEIFNDGKWITIRDYIAERETLLRAEHQAREEQELRKRQETERRLYELEERQRADSLEKERRRAADLESSKAQQAIAEQVAFQTVPPPRRSGSGVRAFGTLLLFAGLAVSGYFFLAYDTSVATGSGRVVNLGLMADRQNGIIIGIGLCVVGTILLAVGSRTRTN
jgi:hypothetical protein